MFNFNTNEWTSLIYYIILLVMLLSSFFVRTTTDRGNKLKQLAIWLIIIFLGVLLYNNKHMFKNFIPYVATETGENQLEIRKTNDKHFYITLNISGTNILFLIDTGATTTTLTLKDAERLGIDTSNLKYNQIVSTANGMTYNASVEIHDIKIGNKIIDSLWVMVSRDLDGNSLLGMNFLNKLNGYDIRNDRMTLYY